MRLNYKNHRKCIVMNNSKCCKFVFCYLHLFEKKTRQNCLELLHSFASISRETQQLRAIGYKVFKTLNSLNLNFMKGIILSFYEPNSQKKQSLC